MELETLLRFLDRRVIFAFTAFLVVAFVWGRWSGEILERADFWMHPPAPVSSPLAADLKKDVQARESAKLRGLYKTVNAELAAARARGAKIENLQQLADTAMDLDSEKYRGAAIERLNKLRLVIPQPNGRILPANGEDLNPEKAQETPKPKRVKRR